MYSKESTPSPCTITNAADYIVLQIVHTPWSSWFLSEISSSWGAMMESDVKETKTWCLQALAAGSCLWNNTGLQEPALIGLRRLRP